jgi:hypothetical protein
MDLEKHASKECSRRGAQNKWVGLYYTPFSKPTLNAQAYLRNTGSPKTPLSGAQLRNFG